jgi:putative flippase GtrA
MAGTATGLVSKYVLDKFWIFDDRSVQITDNLLKFFLYTLTGALTTSIFWGLETTFALLGDRQSMRYLGAAIGLAIGYFVKFHLDKRFVFRGRI